MSDSIYLTLDTFDDVINLFDKIAVNLSRLKCMGSKSFVRLPLRHSRDLCKIAVADIIRESEMMIERLYDEVAHQIQYGIIEPLGD